jgi:hypothetical protein
MQALKHHLKELRVSRFAVLSAQSLPPKPSLQLQTAEHLKSRIVQDGRLFPEGSRKMHSPFPEQSDPGKKRIMRIMHYAESQDMKQIVWA